MTRHRIIHRTAAALLALCAAGFCAPLHAQPAADTRPSPSLGTVWVPDAPAASGSARRQRERPPAPGAWIISDAQWDQFRAAAIATGLKLRVIIRLNTLRARDFKDDLVALVASIPGWEVEDQGTYTAGTLASFDGILIQNASGVDPTPAARALMGVFEASGILPLPTFEAWEPDKLRVVIGAPP